MPKIEQDLDRADRNEKAVTHAEGRSISRHTLGAHSHRFIYPIATIHAIRRVTHLLVHQQRSHRECRDDFSLSCCCAAIDEELFCGIDDLLTFDAVKVSRQRALPQMPRNVTQNWQFLDSAK